MERTHYIYALTDPAMYDLIFYIGRTINPERRYADHRAACNTSEQLTRWIEYLRKQGRLPHMVILTTATNERDASRLEERTIAILREAGLPLTNKASNTGADTTLWRTIYGYNPQRPVRRRYKPPLADPPTKYQTPNGEKYTVRALA